tara:strand:- start:369 stop:1634 length:1266 start_codon:yes stop_codon:yes gene_type:complete
METEAKTAVDALGHAFEEFKKANDQKITEIEKKGHADPITVEKVERINADVSRLQAEVKAAGDRADKLETAFKRAPGSRDEEKQNAVELERKAVRDFMRKGAQSYMGDFFSSVAEYKAMSVGSDPDGGYTVLPDVTGQIVKKLYETSPMRQVASVQTISTDALEGVTDKDEGTSGWVAETDSRAETGTPQMAKWRIPVHEQYANPKVTQQLLDDSAVNIESWLAAKVADKMSRSENTAFVSGSGVGRPRGFVDYTSSSVTTADSTRTWGVIQHKLTAVNGSFGTGSNAADNLVDFVHKLKAGYRQNAVWLMNRTSLGAARQIKDGNNQYIWLPTMLSGQNSTLLGYPIVEMEDLADYSTTDAYAVWFGDFKQGYQIVDRQGIRVLRDPFSSKPYVSFYTTKRVGGDVLNTEAIKALKFGTA